jgi:hypothetical protein
MTAGCCWTRQHHGLGSVGQWVLLGQTERAWQAGWAGKEQLGRERTAGQGKDSWANDAGRQAGWGRLILGIAAEQAERAPQRSVEWAGQAGRAPQRSVEWAGQAERAPQRSVEWAGQAE